MSTGFDSYSVDGSPSRQEMRDLFGMKGVVDAFEYIAYVDVSLDNDQLN